MPCLVSLNTTTTTVTSSISVSLSLSLHRMSSNRRKLLRNTVVVNLGCSCQRPKLSDIFRPKPKNKTSTYRKPDVYRSSSSSWDDSNTTFDTYSEAEEDPKSSKAVTGFGKIGESVAVVKDSDDPYLDFRHSMLQMILEKEIYSREDLRELLQCFLSLNSPYHHEVIVRAFTEIWNGVFSVKPESSKSRRKSREF